MRAGDSQETVLCELVNQGQVDEGWSVRGQVDDGWSVRDR